MKCKKCGAQDEQIFSWDGKCLMCEENDNFWGKDDESEQLTGGE